MSGMPKPASDIQCSYRSILDMLPDSIMAHVVQYLKLDDVIHQGKGNVLEFDQIVPNDIIFQYIKWTNIKEPIRLIFKDFARGDNVRRLQKLKCLMKSTDFVSCLSLWGSVFDLTLSYQGFVDSLHSKNYLNEFLEWIEAVEDSPAKEFVLSKLGNEAQLRKLIKRGRWSLFKKNRWQRRPALPAVFIDVFGKLIAKGDQESVLLFDQLLSNPDLKKCFVCDVRLSFFADSMVQISRKGGQPNVLLKDEVMNNLTVEAFTELTVKKRSIIRSAIAHDRLDILDGIVKNFVGMEFDELFHHVFSEILWNARSNPDYDFKLAKDLLQNNVDAIRNAPRSEGDDCSSLHDKLLHTIIYEDPTPQLQSLLVFMMAQFKSNGIQFSAEEALRAASLHGNDFYNDLFITCL